MEIRLADYEHSALSILQKKKLWAVLHPVGYFGSLHRTQAHCDGGIEARYEALRPTFARLWACGLILRNTTTGQLFLSKSGKFALNQLGVQITDETLSIACADYELATLQFVAATTSPIRAIPNPEPNDEEFGTFIALSDPHGPATTMTVERLYKDGFLTTNNQHELSLTRTGHFTLAQNPIPLLPITWTWTT